MKKRCKPNKDEVTGRYLNNGQSRKVGLNRAISDASWYELRQKIKYAAAKSGKIFEVVPPHHTSQECPECHHIDASNRDGEKFVCGECGYSADADQNGANNVKHRGVKMLGITLKCRVKIEASASLSFKVREDFAEPKQLVLFETPNQPESTGSRQLRRHRTTRKGSKRGVPGNPPIQLGLWDISGLA